MRDGLCNCIEPAKIPASSYSNLINAGKRRSVLRFGNQMKSLAKSIESSFVCSVPEEYDVGISLRACQSQSDQELISSMDLWNLVRTLADIQEIIVRGRHHKRVARWEKNDGLIDHNVSILCTTFE
jgi:hypothetical protein